MPELILKQILYETETWKRLLAFMQDENIHLKNRLSEILREKFDNEMLDEVEKFQNSFMKEDEMISFLKSDIAEMDKLLVREVFEDGKIVREVNRNLQKIRSNITNAEKQFSSLKSSFNSYLADNIHDRV